MYDMLVETVVIVFVMGGLLGAITALHLTAARPVKEPVRNKPHDHREKH